MENQRKFVILVGKKEPGLAEEIQRWLNVQTGQITGEVNGVVDDREQLKSEAFHEAIEFIEQTPESLKLCCIGNLEGKGDTIGCIGRIYDSESQRWKEWNSSLDRNISKLELSFDENNTTQIITLAIPFKGAVGSKYCTDTRGGVHLTLQLHLPKVTSNEFLRSITLGKYTSEKNVFLTHLINTIGTKHLPGYWKLASKDHNNLGLIQTS